MDLLLSGCIATKLDRKLPGTLGVRMMASPVVGRGLVSPPCLASSRLAAASVFSPRFPGPADHLGLRGTQPAWWSQPGAFFFSNSDSDCSRFPIGSPSDQTVAPLPVITAPPPPNRSACRVEDVTVFIGGGKENASWQGGENGVGCRGGESLFDGVGFQLGSVTELCR